MVKRQLGRMRAIDFFCGAGGMTYGFEQAGIKVIAGVDIDSDCKETYEINNPDSNFINIDIHKLSVEKLEEITGIHKLDASLVFIACSPCQYFSQIKTKKHNSEKFKNLLEEFWRFVIHFQPGYLVIENVPGITTHKDSPLPKFLHNIESLGYSHDKKVIDCQYYGVPQTRRRFVMLASRTNKLVTLPQKSSSGLKIKEFIGIQNGFAKIKAGHMDNTDFMHTVRNLTEVNIERLKLTPKNGGTRLAWKDNPSLQINAYRGKDDGFFTDVYGRMSWEKPAPTITTKFTSISNGRFGHPQENRGLSLREGATLQTFPITYKFRGKSIASLSRQIGNAVPPILAKTLASSILSCHNINY